MNEGKSKEKKEEACWEVCMWGKYSFTLMCEKRMVNRKIAKKK